MSKYGCLFELNCCFYTQFGFTIGPLVICFALNLSLFIIRINCQNAYLSLFGKDTFLRLNGFLIFLNFFQMFLIILIILFFVLLFFVSNERLCKICNLCCDCCCIFIFFFVFICAKKESKKKEKHSSKDKSECINIKNDKKPPNLSDNNKYLPTETESLKFNNNLYTIKSNYDEDKDEKEKKRNIF